MYIYIYSEREREIERDVCIERERDWHACVQCETYESFDSVSLSASDGEFLLATFPGFAVKSCKITQRRKNN